MFSKQAIIMLDHNVLKGYVSPGCRDEAEIQKTIADFLASTIAEVGGRITCYGDCDNAPRPQISSDAQ